MLEGLEAVEINFKKLNAETRFDAEYFSKNYLKFAQQLNQSRLQTVGAFAYVTDGIHASIDYAAEGGINLISATSPRQNTFDLSRQVFITEAAHSVNPRTALKDGDVIISTVGTIGNCAVVDESILPANSDRHVGIIRNLKKVKPYFLSTFLLSKYGKFQALRESTGNVQLNLFLYKIRQLLVPSFSEKFQIKIEATVKTAIDVIRNSEITFSRAEALLINTLGFSNFAPSTEAINVKSLKTSFASTGRLDAEHYQPKYDQLHQGFTDFAGVSTTVDDLAGDIVNGAEIREYQDQGTAYLRVGDLKSLDIDIASVVYIDPKRAKSGLAKIGLRAGDVLISRSGSLAVAAVVESVWESALISSHLIRLRIRDTRIDPYFLALFFMTLPGKMQIQMWSNGGVQPEISQPALKAIIVPILPLLVQHEIRRLILEARRLRAVSENLLEVAKRAVEIAIEQDEAAGMAYLAIEGALA